MADELIQGSHGRQERLLPAAHDLAMRLGADPRGGSPAVRLLQNGRMRQVGAARWMAFRASQTIATLHCAFDWRARVGPAGLISVHDALTGDGGRLEVRALGFIPVAHARSSPALTRGELMRYLAELAWSPNAILHNAALRWREDRPDILVVGAGFGETAAEVVLSLDGQGRIAGGYAPDRPRAVGRSFLPTPWHGRFSDYRRHGGMWLPFAGEVAWVIDGVEDVCWQAQIEHLEALDACG